MGGAERVDSGAHGDVVPLDRAVVGDGQGDAALAGHAEVADAGERAERADVDILARSDDDGPEGGCLEIDRHTGGGQDEQRKQKGPQGQGATEAVSRFHG